jgi:predicted metal-binding membrane protein
MPRPLTLLSAIVISAASPLVNVLPAAAQQPAGQIEALLKDGWDVAGYVAAWENRTLILLKNREKPYLIQCSVLIDVTRNPRVVTVCYELR